MTTDPEHWTMQEFLAFEATITDDRITNARNLSKRLHEYEAGGTLIVLAVYDFTTFRFRIRENDQNTRT